MLSILIPVYNFDIRNLVSELHCQAILENVPFEIIIIDDASDKGFCTVNREIENLSNVSYTELEKNIGRSKIRNSLSKKALFNYLLFMDCDARITSKTYIKNYVKQCIGEVVVCGGTAYESSKENNDFGLRINYGNKRESKSALYRNQAPNNCFSSFNFLISKSILQRITFDESITQYGHEDTLFGLELKRHNIKIRHIENSLVHLGLESNPIFLSKALLSVKNLYTIFNNDFYNKELKRDIKLLNYYNKIKLLGLAPVVGLMYHATQKSISKNLISSGQNLFYFDILRLGFLCTLK
jgi:hypothetical protein